MAKSGLGKGVQQILAEQARQSPTAFALNEAGQFIAELMRAELSKQGLDNSRLIQSLAVEVDGRAATLAILAPAYALWVEAGRKPYGVDQKRPVNTMPPAHAILAWVKRKKIKGRDKRAGRKGRFITDAQLVWAIRKMIARRGIRPRPFIEPAIDQGLPAVDEFIQLNWDIQLDGMIGLIASR